MTALKVAGVIALVVVANLVFNDLALDRVRDLDAPDWIDAVDVPDRLDEPLHWSIASRTWRSSGCSPSA